MESSNNIAEQNPCLSPQNNESHSNGCNYKCWFVVAIVIIIILLIIISILSSFLDINRGCDCSTKTKERLQNMTYNVNITGPDSDTSFYSNVTTQNASYSKTSSECNTSFPLTDHMKKWELNLNITGSVCNTYINTTVLFNGNASLQSNLCTTIPCLITRMGYKHGHKLSVYVVPSKTIICNWIIKEYKND